MRSSSRPHSRAYCTKLARSSALAVHTRNPYPAFKNALAIFRPGPLDLPAPVAPDMKIPVVASSSVQASFFCSSKKAMENQDRSDRYYRSYVNNVISTMFTKHNR